MRSSSLQKKEDSLLRRNAATICIRVLIIGVALSLLLSASIYFNLNLIEQNVATIGALSVVHTSEINSRSALAANMEYASALGKCNGDMIIATFPTETKLVSLINDDFCDCLEGQDEYLTAACSNFLVGVPTYECRSVENKVKNLRSNGINPIKTIFTSRVQDEVCDCDDCSDEQPAMV